MPFFRPYFLFQTIYEHDHSGYFRQRCNSDSIQSNQSPIGFPVPHRRQSQTSVGSTDSGLEELMVMQKPQRKSSNILGPNAADESAKNEFKGDSILGMVHLQLALYHEGEGKVMRAKNVIVGLRCRLFSVRVSRGIMFSRFNHQRLQVKNFNLN